jgi:hypothetical protein
MLLVRSILFYEDQSRSDIIRSHMREDIASKLNRELDQEIESERQVVYILVESRKLLEQQKTLDNFRALKLCSDWALHPKLRGPDSQIVLKHFDGYEIEYQKSRITVAEFPLEPLHDFMSHIAFRAELIEALAPFGVRTDRFTSDVFWRSFIHQYSSVIQDCPFEAIDNNTELVTHVSGQAWPKEMADTIFPGKRVIQWNWILKSAVEREKLVRALI